MYSQVTPVNSGVSVLPTENHRSTPRLGSVAHSRGVSVQAARAVGSTYSAGYAAGYPSGEVYVTSSQTPLTTVLSGASQSRAHAVSGAYTNHSTFTKTGTYGTRSKSLPFTSDSVRIGEWMAPAGAVVTESRLVSSSIVHEETMGQIPPMDVKTVEVPGHREEKIERISKKEVRHVEKRVPKIEIEYVDRTVEVPKIEYVQKIVEIPQVQHVVRHVPKIEIVERPYEVIKSVPRIETQVVEKVVEVPEIVEVPKPYVVEQKVSVPRYVDEDAFLVVDQQVNPTVSLSNESVDVDVVEYVAEPVTIDIHIAKIADMTELAAVDMHTKHKVVSVPTGQYNSMLQHLNRHITQYQQLLPYMQENGTVPMLSTQVDWQSPPDTAEIEGYQLGMLHCQGRPVNCAANLEGLGEGVLHAVRGETHITGAEVYNTPAFYARWGNGRALSALATKGAARIHGPPAVATVAGAARTVGVAPRVAVLPGTGYNQSHLSAKRHTYQQQLAPGATRPVRVI
ncbi:MAG: uncharacterized protein KVP18_003445 [Porospora cf. gigantea A]|uniref:uncharacterized protein n=1 Tax=Porospora cf. gigantea A TaxID=2853593 RepID=UPI0035593F9D|nr:MAG: hypothetical protein KVP18_003445 [Porospora cf. gigantea A]